MYKMYLGINNGEEGFMLPVLPEKIEVNESGDNKTYDIINLGEVNTINLPKLMEIGIESYFPLYSGPYVSSEQLFDPSFYVSKIREWRNKKQKIRFIFTGSQLEINDLFTIENFKVLEKGGEVGDIYYSMDIKRYKAYGSKKVIIVQPKVLYAAPVIQSAPPQRPAENPPVNAYTVVSGDTLWYIAKRFLGDGNRYNEIAALNNIKNPGIISPGQVLKLL